MKLNYKVLGDGPPMVILHGLFGMLDNWQGPARFFESQFMCILVDLRNHGHSPHSRDFNYHVMVDDVVELMDDLQLVKAHILGHSMGGKVAMLLAQTHPERVDRLIVADISPRYYPVHHHKIIAALRAVPLKEIQRRTDAETYMAPFIPEPAVRQFLMKSLFFRERNVFDWRFYLDGIEANIQAVGEATDALEYQGISLFMRGDRSDYITDVDWAGILTVFPEALLVTIGNAGHWLHAEQPENFANEVLEFLKLG